MNKKFSKIILIGAVVALFIFSLVIYFFGKSNPGPTNKPSQYQLSPKQEQEIQVMVENFAVLYNSYEYKNYDNIRALYDSQIPDMQTKLDAYLGQLDKTTPAGFKRQTEVVAKSFFYKPVSENKISAQVTAQVKDQQNNQTSSYFVIVSLELLKGYDAWSVSDIKIDRQ